MTGVDRGAGIAVGITALALVNDAFLAAVLGGFRRYHEHFSVPIDTMPVAMPISLRTAADAAGGNRFAAARFAAPVAEPDPRERMRQVREFVITARTEPAINAATLLSPALSHLPGSLVARILALSPAGQVVVHHDTHDQPGIARALWDGAPPRRVHLVDPIPVVWGDWSVVEATKDCSSSGRLASVLTT